MREVQYVTKLKITIIIPDIFYELIMENLVFLVFHATVLKS